MTEEVPESKTHAERFRPHRYKPTLPQGREDALIWLAHEVANVSREAQLRIEDATDFVTQYSRGRMSPEEFDQRETAYMRRWGNPLKGLLDCRGMSSEDILKYIDAGRESRAKIDQSRSR